MIKLEYNGKIGLNSMAVKFLVTHKWVKPRRRGFVKMPSQYRAATPLKPKDTAVRYYCVKCGAVKFTVHNILGYSHYPNTDSMTTYFRAWGDIARKVQRIPYCEGVIPERAPIGV